MKKKTKIIVEEKTIKIFIDGGALQDVQGLPEGYNYQLFDRDNDPDEYDKEVEG